MDEKQIENAVVGLAGLIPGPWGIIATLIAKEGVPFVDHLIANGKNNVPATPETYAELRKKARTPMEEL